jgi:hypothetical protein
MSEMRRWELAEITGGRGADHVLEMGGGDITRSVNLSGWPFPTKH